jgi:hypothetical protein
MRKKKTFRNSHVPFLPFGNPKAETYKPNPLLAYYKPFKSWVSHRNEVFVSGDVDLKNEKFTRKSNKIHEIHKIILNRKDDCLSCGITKVYKL